MIGKTHEHGKAGGGLAGEAQRAARGHGDAAARGPGDEREALRKAEEGRPAPRQLFDRLIVFGFDIRHPQQDTEEYCRKAMMGRQAHRLVGPPVARRKPTIIAGGVDR